MPSVSGTVALVKIQNYTCCVNACTMTIRWRLCYTEEFLGSEGLICAYSVVLPLDDLVTFCGLGRHLQLARSACFQLLDLTHANADKSEKRESTGVCLGLYDGTVKLDCWIRSPWLGQICGWTWRHAPPCALRRGSPCPGRSLSAGWIAPWRSRQGRDLPGNHRTQGPRTMPQSPGSSRGSRAMRRGHRCRQKEDINKEGAVLTCNIKETQKL